MLGVQDELADGGVLFQLLSLLYLAVEDPGLVIAVEIPQTSKTVVYYVGADALCSHCSLMLEGTNAQGGGCFVLDGVNFLSFVGVVFSQANGALI